jgi:hypothetical protein
VYLSLSKELAMQVLPSASALRVLLAWSEVVARQRRWVRITASEIPVLSEMDAVEIRGCVAELAEMGCCTPAAHGDLYYISRRGATLARATRELLSQGLELGELTPASLAPKLIRFPYIFRDTSARTALRAPLCPPQVEQVAAAL